LGEIVDPGYGEYIWELDPESDDVISWDKIAGDVTSAIYDELSSGFNPLDIDLTITGEDLNRYVAETDDDYWEIAKQASTCFAPQDIVEGAAAWDAPEWVEWFCDRFPDIKALAWGEGAVVLDDTVDGLKYLGVSDD
jgi:hypothetical protein